MIDEEEEAAAEERERVAALTLDELARELRDLAVEGWVDSPRDWAHFTVPLIVRAANEIAASAPPRETQP